MSMLDVIPLLYMGRSRAWRPSMQFSI